VMIATFPAVPSTYAPAVGVAMIDGQIAIHNERRYRFSAQRRSKERSAARSPRCLDHSCLSLGEWSMIENIIAIRNEFYW
jgi:hypothetical protein